MLSLNNLNIVTLIKALPVSSIYTLSKGLDSLDIICNTEYGSDLEYYKYLAYYNDILMPFNLIDQGIYQINLFNKKDLLPLVSLM